MKYLFLFGGQGLNFLIAVFNIRAASRGKIWLTGSSDFVFCVVNFLLIQYIAVASSWLEILAYASGGMIGSMLAVRFTRRWDHS
mgnify:CR=1 FL=1